MKQTEKKTGRKATTRSARAASTKAIRAAVAREARRRGISPAELIRQSSDAHKRMSARGKNYRAPIMDAEPTQAPSVTFTDDGDAVTIRVAGKAYRNLAKVAAASNKCKWTDDDGSPATVAEYWVGSLLERCENTPHEDPNNGIKEVIDDIVVSIDTGFDEGSHEDEERRAQLKAAFDEIDWENGGAA